MLNFGFSELHYILRMIFQEKYTACYFLLANIANTKCPPFQVMINCSKFIADRLQQRCHVTFLIYLFVTSRNLLFGVFCQGKLLQSYENYQASVTERCTSLSKCSGMFRQNLLKVPVKKLYL